MWILLCCIWAFMAWQLWNAGKKLYSNFTQFTETLISASQEIDRESKVKIEKRLFEQAFNLVKLTAKVTVFTWLVLGISPILFYQISNFVSGWNPLEEKMLPSIGELGDVFGIVNTLFSGLAFVGVVFAIVLQTIELRYQRQETLRSNEEYAKQSKSMKETVYLSAAANVLNAYHLDFQNMENPNKGTRDINYLFLRKWNETLLFKRQRELSDIAEAIDYKTANEVYLNLIKDFRTTCIGTLTYIENIPDPFVHEHFKQLKLLCDHGIFKIQHSLLEIDQPGLFTELIRKILGIKLETLNSSMNKVIHLLKEVSEFNLVDYNTAPGVFRPEKTQPEIESLHQLIELKNKLIQELSQQYSDWTKTLQDEESL